MNSFNHGVARLVNACGNNWMIEPSAFRALAIAGENGQQPGRQGKPRSGGVAIIPITNAMTPRGSYMGGASCADLINLVREAARSNAVNRIVLDIHSPGGSVHGTQELYQTIATAAAIKPVTAAVNCFCASAAYYVACAATEIVCSPSGQVGSVGVWTYHVDVSKALDDAGIKVTYISSSPEKIEGASEIPLSDPARKAMQAEVDGYYGDFLRAVATGRRTTPEKVKASFGKGRMVRPAEALAAGMIDRVGTLNEVLSSAWHPVGPWQPGGRAARAFAALALAERS